mmetsp:Transcript_61216/g.173871  ORF Transcript_61216/g.173871 Transcript_61216/m.173871 type:complete len:173 (+) Transcript_61216:1574-2092(+)
MLGGERGRKPQRICTAGGQCHPSGRRAWHHGQRQRQRCHWYCQGSRYRGGCRWAGGSQPTHQPASQPTSQPANQLASHPANQPTSKPANQSTTQPVNQPTHRERRGCCRSPFARRRQQRRGPHLGHKEVVLRTRRGLAVRCEGAAGLAGRRPAAWPQVGEHCVEAAGQGRPP